MMTEHRTTSPARAEVSRTFDALGRIPELRTALSVPHVRDLIPSFSNMPWKLDHSVRMALSLHELHGYLGSSPETQQASIRAALGHDSAQVRTTTNKEGRVVTAEDKRAILNKPGLLTDAEWDVVQDHPVDAGHYFEEHHDHEAAGLIHDHHTFQGKRSYPHTTDLRSADPARALFAAVDTVDALLTPRPYPKWVDVDGERRLIEAKKEPWTREAVLEELGGMFEGILGQDVLDQVVKVGQKYTGKTVHDLALAA